MDDDRDAARAAAADLFGCEPAEVVFGNNATSLVLRASRALARTWDAGDNIVLSSLDHDCNAGPWAWAGGYPMTYSGYPAIYFGYPVA